MTEIKFKTNINCNHCIGKVTPILNEYPGTNSWNVDLNTEDKILTVSVENPDADKIVASLADVGYIAEKI